MQTAHGSYLKGDSGKDCAGYGISISFDVMEVAPLPLATTAPQAKLHALTQACTLGKGKTAICTDSRYAF